MIALALPLLLALLPAGDEPVARTHSGLVLGRQEFADWLVERVGYSHVQDCITEKIVLSAAEEAGLLPEDDEVDAALAAERAFIVQNYHRGDEQAYVAELRARGLDPAAHERRRWHELRFLRALEKMAARERTISEDDLRQRFDQVYGELGERVVVEVRFFDLYRGVQPGDRPDLSRQKEEALARARAAREAWLAGRLDEVDALSDVPKADVVRDGRIDPYTKRVLGNEVEAAVNSLDEPNEISPPLPVWNGAWLVRLVSRTEVDFAEVRDELLAELAASPVPEAEVSAMRRRLLDEARIEPLLR